MKNAKFWVLFTYSIVISIAAIVLFMQKTNSEHQAPIPKLQIDFYGWGPESDENWLGVKTIESYYMENQKKILHGECVRIQYKHPKVIMYTNRYRDGESIGTDVVEHDFEKLDGTDY